MYGFGDDRTPASDTVDVMEEILIEYIIDIVSYIVNLRLQAGLYCRGSVTQLLDLAKSPGYLSKICAGHFHDQQMRKNLREWKNSSSCKKISRGPVRSLRSRK